MNQRLLSCVGRKTVRGENCWPCSSIFFNQVSVNQEPAQTCISRSVSAGSLTEEALKAALLEAKIKKGTDPNVQINRQSEKTGSTALALAAAQGHAEPTKLLIAHGVRSRRPLLLYPLSLYRSLLPLDSSKMSKHAPRCTGW